MCAASGRLGLDQQDWTERFLKAYTASGQMLDDDRSWTAFASNVGKARILRHDAIEMRLRWVGAILLLLVVAAAATSPCAITACAPAGGPRCCPPTQPTPPSMRQSLRPGTFFAHLLSWLGH